MGVSFCFYGADIWTQLTVNGSQFTLDPNSFHHTLNISGFPFLRNDTQLSLKTHLDVISRVVQLNETDLLDPNEGALDLSDPTDTSGSKPIAAWSETVQVSGTDCSATAPVVRSVIFDGEVQADLDGNITAALAAFAGEISLSLVERILYFSFLTDCPMPSDIYWDPDVGFEIDSSSNINFAAYNIPSFALIAMVLIGLYF